MNPPEAAHATPVGGRTVHYNYMKTNTGRYGMIAAVGAAALAGYFFYRKKRAEDHPVKAQADRLQSKLN